MKMTGKMLLCAFALVLAGVHATHSCPAILEGTFTKVFQGSEPSGYNQKDFDDSSWNVLSFPLASCPNCYQEPFEKQPSSFIDPKHSIYSRTVLILTGPVWGGQLQVRTGDNSAWIFVNGVHVGDVHKAEQCSGYRGFPWVTVNIKEGILREGTNIIAIKEVTGDHKRAYLDIRLSVDQKNPCWLRSAVLQCPAVGQGSTTRTLQYSANPPAGSNDVDFNDASFDEQTFPLGENVGLCERTACLDIKGWLPSTSDRILTRTEFYLPHVPKYDAWLRVSAVEAWVRVNGVSIGEIHSNDCKSMETGRDFTIPTSVLREGTNVLAVTVAGRVEKDVSLVLPELNICDLFCPADLSAWSRELEEESIADEETVYDQAQ